MKHSIAGMSLVDLLVGAGVLSLGGVLLSGTMQFYHQRSELERRELEQYSSALQWVTLLQKDLSSAETVVSEGATASNPPTSFLLSQKTWTAGRVLEKQTRYSFESSAQQCQSWSGAKFDCIKIKRTQSVGTGLNADPSTDPTTEVAQLAGVRWCVVTGSSSTECTALGGLFSLPSAAPEANRRLLLEVRLPELAPGVAPPAPLQLVLAAAGTRKVNIMGPVPAVVNCVGTWNKNCQTKEATFSIQVPPSGGGVACTTAAGATRSTLPGECPPNVVNAGAGLPAAPWTCNSTSADVCATNGTQLAGILIRDQNGGGGVWFCRCPLHGGSCRWIQSSTNAECP